MTRRRHAAPSPARRLSATAHIYIRRPVWWWFRKEIKVTTATLKWTDPTTRTDGSSLSAGDISGVDVFDNDVKIGSVAGGAQSFTTGPLDVGDHAFTVVVKDNDGHSSAKSNVATVTISPTKAAPTAVSDLSVTTSE